MYECGESGQDLRFSSSGFSEYGSKRDRETKNEGKFASSFIG